MNAILLLASTFILVFALGLQSQLVNNGHYFGAFLNSVMISVSNLGALQIVGAHTGIEYAAYILGGPVGIVCSMVMYRRVLRKRGQPSISLSPAHLADCIPKTVQILDGDTTKRRRYAFTCAEIVDFVKRLDATRSA